MTSDPDLVLKSFGSSSETTFLLLYTLQLFLAKEENKTRNAYEIPEESVFALCASPARLPAHIRDFILWQRNILKLDDREILETEMPRGLTKKYAVKSKALERTDDAQERAGLIDECIAEQNVYLERLNEVRAILEATEDRFVSVEETLLRAESLDERLVRVLADQKQELDRMRQELTALRADLEHSALPDLIKFQDTPKKAMRLMTHLSEVNLHTRDAIRKHNLADDEWDED